MITDIWSDVVEAMGAIGYKIDPSEGDSLQDRRYTITLPLTQRSDDTSTFSRTRVTRDVRIRLQFRDRKDTFFQKDMAQDVERVIVALRPLLLFEAATLIERTGGMIAEVQFSVDDSVD